MNLDKKAICISLIVILLFSMFNTGASAFSPSQNNSISGIEDSKTDPASDIYLAIPPVIQLKAATFDPLIEKPNIPSQLTYSQDNGYFLVQCKGPILSEWIEELKESGAVILGYIPNYTYILYLNPNEKPKLEDLDFVRWVGNFQPAYKIQNNLLNLEGEIELRIMVFNDREENVHLVRETLRYLGGTITSDGEVNRIIRVKIDAAKIPNIASIPQVEWIDLYQNPRSLMSNIRGYTGATTVHLNGFDGTGIVGEVKDSGIDLTHPDFNGQILATDGTIIDDPHGTPVFGIVFSSGTFDSNAKGMMPGGQGVFCSWDVLPLTSISNLVNNWGGVFQSNSWSTGANDSNYTSASYEHDQGVFNYDISIFHSAGNSGIAPYTCTQESVAKNVIAVGGIFHLNTQSKSDDTWSNFGPGSTPAQGPAEDGRVKPDLSGPFDMIYTTDSVDGDGEDGYDVGDYTSDFGGTSGATPVVSGAAGLLYQMYKENHFGNNPGGEIPHASTVKAILIADAFQYNFAQADRYQQGWGSVDIGMVYSIGDEHYIEDEPTSLATSESQKFYVTPTGGGPLKISLVWTDVPASPGSNPALVNDLDLKVVDPVGTIYLGNYGLDSSKWSSSGGSKDNINNVENVFIQSPSAGTWSVEVIGANVPFEGDTSTGKVDQTYSLVATNALGRLAINITDPENGEWLKGNTTISGISRGPVVQIEVKIDGGSWDIATGTFNWNYDWNTQLYSEGSQTIYARAFNGTDYSDEESITVYVDNTSPTTNIVAGSPNYFNGTKWFVVLTTPFTLVGNDAGGSGIANNWYRILYESTQVQPWVTGSSFMLSWGAGSYVIQYYSEDNLGNTGDFLTIEAFVDMDPPQTTLTLFEPKHKDPTSEYWNASIYTTFVLSPAEDETGISFKWYIIDGQYFEGESFNLLGYSEDWHEIQWGSCDLLGHNESGNSQYVFLDRSPPTVDKNEGTPQFREYAFNWLNVTNETTFNIDSSDSVSGVNFTWYSINGDFNFGSSFTLDGYENGTYTILFGALDNVDNNESIGPFIYNLDLNAPSTLMIINDPLYRNSENDPWNVTKATDFELFAFDKFSGVLKTWYRIDGTYYESSYIEHIKFNLASVDTDGPLLISWGSMDNLSQSESDNFMTVILDTKGPETQMNIGEPKYRGSISDEWNVTQDTIFTLISNDTYSGVNLIWYEIDGNHFEGSTFNLSGLAQSYHTITWGAEDNLGNLENGNSQKVYLGRNPPQTTHEIIGDKYRDSINDHYNVTIDTEFLLSASEVHQGINYTWYTIDGNYFEGDSFDLSGLSEGMHIISWSSVDNLGLVEEDNTDTVYLDINAPDSVLEIGEPKYRMSSSDPWVVNAESEFTVVANDGYSGVDFSWYTINGVYKKGSSFDLSGYSEGTHTISWGSADNLEHEGTGGTVTVDLDLQAPVITIVIGEPSITDDDTIYLTSDTPISFIFADSGVNQSTVFYSLDGGTRFEMYISPFTVPSQTTSIVFSGQDILGNSQGESEVDVIVDNTDSDSDGTVDLEDLDDDNDGLLDTQEDINQNGKVDFGETDPKDPDTDSDGYNDKIDTFPLDSTKFNGEGAGSSLVLILILVGVVVLVLFLYFMLQKKGKGEEVQWEDHQEVQPVQPQQVQTYPPPPPPPSDEVEFETHYEEETEFEHHK